MSRLWNVTTHEYREFVVLHAKSGLPLPSEHRRVRVNRAVGVVSCLGVHVTGVRHSFTWSLNDTSPPRLRSALCVATPTLCA